MVSTALVFRKKHASTALFRPSPLPAPLSAMMPPHALTTKEAVCQAEHPMLESTQRHCQQYEQHPLLRVDGCCLDCPVGSKRPMDEAAVQPQTKKARNEAPGIPAPAEQPGQAEQDCEAEPAGSSHDPGEFDPPVQAHREDCSHPVDAPPDEAIGQPRCDEPPVIAVDSVPPLPLTSMITCPATPRSMITDELGTSVSARTLTWDTETLMRCALLSLEPKVPVSHAAFAELISRRLESHYAIEREDKEKLVTQWYDDCRGSWVRGGGARRLHQVTTHELYDIFHERLDEKQLSLFGNDGFVTPVVRRLLNYLPAASNLPPLDGDASRGLLHFSCGSVLDFKTGTLRLSEARYRISLCTGYLYADWAAPQESKLHVQNLCRDLNNLWAEDLDVDEIGASRLEETLRHSPLYVVLYGLFDDHSVALWLLRQCTRAAAGLSGYAEILWCADARGSNGKGAVLALMKAVLGAENGYYGTLEYERHVVGAGMTKQSVNNPDIAALAGKRFVAVNESPDSTMGPQPLNTTLIKRLASGGDDPISAMANTRTPVHFSHNACSCSAHTTSQNSPRRMEGSRDEWRTFATVRVRQNSV